MVGERFGGASGGEGLDVSMLVELVIKLYNVIQVAVDVDKVSYAKKSSASLDLGARSVGLPEPTAGRRAIWVNICRTWRSSMYVSDAVMASIVSATPAASMCGAAGQPA
jgi:hypothetical protein